ncbi:MAG: hypothetical protein ACK4VN_13370 [Bacteroidales bacterium]
MTGCLIELIFYLILTYLYLVSLAIFGVFFVSFGVVLGFGMAIRNYVKAFRQCVRTEKPIR